MVNRLLKFTGYFFCFLGLLIYSGCIIEDPETLTEHILTNNTERKIVLIPYSQGDSGIVILKKNEEIKYEFSEQGINHGNPFSGDSLIVTFDDTLSITHYPWNWTGENVARSIMLEDNWLGGKVEDNYYRYEYTFTDADYQEALEANAKK